MARIIKTDINSADQNSLSDIQGIGRIKAKRIIKHRQKKGFFKSIGDLSKLKGFDTTDFKSLKNSLQAKAPAKAKRSKSEALRFYGQPSNIQGSILLENKTEETQKRFVLQFEQNNKLRFPGKSPGIIKVRNHIDAESRKYVPVSFSLDQATPPGSYITNVVIENESMEAIIDVTESIQVSMHPDLIFIETEPGSSIDKTIYITNQGNIPLNFSDPGAIIIEDENFECRAIRSTVRSMKDVKDFNEALKLAASELENLYDEAGGMRVKIKGKPIRIQPLQTVKIILIFSLPAKLHQGNYYSGAIRFYDDSIKVKVRTLKSIVK